MKNLQTLSAVKTYFTLAFLGLICLTNPGQVVFAETNTLSQSCYESHRGTRCKTKQSPETLAASSNKNTANEKIVCLKSARGTRCHKQPENFIIAEQLTTPELKSKTQCATSARGTRRCNIDAKVTVL